METSSSTNANPALPNTRQDAQSSESSTSASIATDFDTFLTLLTTQLKAQDPLAPVESTQFVEQLATFTSVEQQLVTNDKLDQLINAVGGGGDISSLADWIGKDIEARPDTIAFDGAPISFAAPEQDKFDGVTASIKNADGEVVRTMNLSKDDAVHVWDGATDDGPRARLGTYTIELNYRTTGATPKTDTAPIAGKVAEVRKTDDGWRLQLEDGRQISVDDVTAARTSVEEISEQSDAA